MVAPSFFVPPACAVLPSFPPPACLIRDDDDAGAAARRAARAAQHDLEEGSYVCVGDATGDFDLSLKDVKDPMTYKGLVIAKGHMEWPLSEEPTVFGYVRFIDDRPDLPSTETALGMLANKAKKPSSSWAKPSSSSWMTVTVTVVVLDRFRRKIHNSWMT